MDARRTDLCTCGKSHNDVVHHVQGLGAPIQGAHTFMPHPQPPALPPHDLTFHRVSAVRNVGWWVAEVYAVGKIGRGQAKQWLDAVNAAVEDLKEK